MEKRKTKVFISYSRDKVENCEWVKKLATDLEVISEIHVIWDRFDLDEQVDVHRYMEKAVVESDFILVVATEDYLAKSQERTGGVGYETTLIINRLTNQQRNLGKSNIVLLLRDENCTPPYLGSSLPINCINRKNYTKNLAKLIELIQGSTAEDRPDKSMKIRTRNSDLFAFTKSEDIIQLIFKNRECVVDIEEGTDFSGSKKVKLELWLTKLPEPKYFLIVHRSSSMLNAIEWITKYFISKNISVKNLIVLRASTASKNNTQEQFKEAGFTNKVLEYSFAEYIWEYCIDDNLKIRSKRDWKPNYIDQAIVQYLPDDRKHLHDSAIQFLQKTVSDELKPAAHLVVATGGMGKSWMCLTLERVLYEAKDLSVSVALIQAEALKQFLMDEGIANIHIESIYDMYEVYARTVDQEMSFNRSEFELAVLCGKLVVIVDGIDELISLLQERMNVEGVFRSVYELHSELGHCNFIFTTRNSLLIENSKLKEYGIEKLELLGFDETNLEAYSKKRFKKFQSADNISKKLSAVLVEVDFRERTGRTIPFIVDLIATILEQDFDDTDTSNFSLNFSDTDYKSNNEITDHVINSLFRREEVRHNLGIPISQVVDLLSTLIVESGNNLDMCILREHLELMYHDRAEQLLLKIQINPLLVQENGSLVLKYGFLKDYFTSLYLIDAIAARSKTEEFFRELARHNYISRLETEKTAKENSVVSLDEAEIVLPDENENRSIVLRQLTKYFTGRLPEFRKSIEILLAELRTRVYSAETDDLQKKRSKRAISVLIKLYASMRNISQKTLATELLELFPGRSKNEILGLYVFGDFPTIAFDGLQVFDCGFYYCKQFQAGSFCDSKFYYTTFERCKADALPSQSFAQAEFDVTCSLGDLEEVVGLSKNRAEEIDARIEKEIKLFFRSFYEAGRFKDQKLQYVHFSNLIGGLGSDKFSKLIKREYFCVKSKNASNTYYQISKSFRRSVESYVSNGVIDKEIREFIDFVR